MTELITNLSCKDDSQVQGQDWVLPVSITPAPKDCYEEETAEMLGEQMNE